MKYELTDERHPDHPHLRRTATVDFLVAHPHCRIGIRDEYGDEHPLADAAPPDQEDVRGERS